MSNVRIATAADWHTLPMPDTYAEFSFRRSFTAEQMKYLRQGFIPAEMEDKWFFYYENNRLYIYRSWTGFCIYIVTFSDDDLLLVRANRNPEQYKCTNEEEDAKRLNGLLDWWSHANYDPYHHFVAETLSILRKAPSGGPADQ